MHMPKSGLPALLLAAILISALFAGCSRSSSQTTPVAQEKLIDQAAMARLLNGKTMAAVYRGYPEVSSENYFENIYKKELPDFDLKAMVNVDSLTEGLLQLRSGKVDALQMMGFTARYLARRDSKITVYSSDSWKSTTHMLFSQSRKASLEKINSALRSMQSDGSLSRLVEQWITALPDDKELTGGSLPVIEGAEVLKVGVSGDEPPLDFMAADGNPGGFNVAVLNEIGRRSGLNIQLVAVTGGARFSALQSSKIDSFLWYNATRPPAGQPTPVTADFGYFSFLISDSYLDAGGAVVMLR